MATLRQRIQRVRDNVPMTSMYEYATGENVVTKFRTEVQVRCHVHGDDKNPSARIYEDSALYCFTCKKKYDSYSYYLAYRGGSYTDVDLQYRLLEEIERHFSLGGIEVTSIVEVHDSSGVQVPGVAVNYNKLFEEMWVFINERAILEKHVSARDFAFEGLEKILRYAHNTKDYRKSWGYLNTLSDKIESKSGG